MPENREPYSSHKPSDQESSVVALWGVDSVADKETQTDLISHKGSSKNKMIQSFFGLSFLFAIVASSAWYVHSRYTQNLIKAEKVFIVCLAFTGLMFLALLSTAALHCIYQPEHFLSEPEASCITFNSQLK